MLIKLQFYGFINNNIEIININNIQYRVFVYCMILVYCIRLVCINITNRKPYIVCLLLLLFIEIFMSP